MKKLFIILFTFSLCSALDFDDIPESVLKKYKNQKKVADDLSEMTDENSLNYRGKENELSTDYPVDEDIYKIGPGDQFNIVYDEKSLKVTVNIEGSITLDEFGIIQLNGLTLKSAKVKITSKIKSIYQKSPCFVNLTKPKSMVIFITGAVSVPGSYHILANQRLSQVLIQSKWFRPDAQKGIVNITHSDSSTETVDLGKFLMGGDLSHNPYLSQGAIIYIPFIDEKKPYVIVRRNNWEIVVQIQGQENLKQIFNRFNLYRASLLPNYFLVIRDGSKEKVNTLEASNYLVKPGDYIDISDYREFVYVGGTIANPGPITYNPDFSVLDYLSLKGITRSSSVSKKTQLIRGDGKKEYIELYSNNIQPGDILMVRDNFQQKVTIWSPIVISMVSMAIAILTLTKL